MLRRQPVEPAGTAVEHELSPADDLSDAWFEDAISQEMDTDTGQHNLLDWRDTGQNEQRHQQQERQQQQADMQDDAEEDGEDDTMPSSSGSPTESDSATSTSSALYRASRGVGNGSEGSQGESSSDTEPGTSQRFDPALASAHGYLGDVEDLQGSYGYLEEGTSYYLPILPLDGVVLFPGTLLPFKLSTDFHRSQVLAALNAPAPCARLLVVLHTALRSSARDCMVGCTAELRKAGSEGNVLTMVAVGRQRALVDSTKSLGCSRHSFRTTILGDGCQERVPRPIRDSSAWLPPWAARAFDVHALAARARELAAVVLAPVSQFHGSPLELSYWIATNLPMGAESRQVLLESRDAAQRLRAIILLLQELDRLVCASCGAQVATTADAISMTQEGLGGVFVNSYGYIHDLVTFARVSGVQYLGRPETEHSWFPGYAWTISHCNTCGEHLGWRFNACPRTGGISLEPKEFWGLRRTALTCTDAERSLGLQLGMPDPDAPHQWGI